MPRLQISPDQSKDPEGQGGGGAKYTLPCKQPEKANDDEIRESKVRHDKQTVNDSSINDGAQVNFQFNSKTFNENHGIDSISTLALVMVVTDYWKIRKNYLLLKHRV